MIDRELMKLLEEFSVYGNKNNPDDFTDKNDGGGSSTPHGEVIEYGVLYPKSDL